MAICAGSYQTAWRRGLFSCFRKNCKDIPILQMCIRDRGKAALIAQDYFVEEAKEKAKKKQEPDETHDRVFVPEEPVPDVED